MANGVGNAVYVPQPVKPAEGSVWTFTNGGWVPAPPAPTISGLTAGRVATSLDATTIQTPASVSTSQAWAFSSTLSVVDGNLSITGSVDATKKTVFEVDAQGSGFTFTWDVGAQTGSRTLTVPVLAGADTIMTLATAQTISGAKTLSAITNFNNTTAASSAITGSITIGNGTAATNVGIGGGNVIAGANISALVDGYFGAVASLPTVGVVRAGGSSTDFLNALYLKNASNANQLYFIIGGGSSPSVPGWANAGVIETGGASLQLSAAAGPVKITTGAARATRINVADTVTSVLQTTAASSSITGSLVIGDGATAATNIGLGGGKIFTGDTTLLHTSVALTNGAAASTGTLSNAPVAGNPTKWVPIDDSGTTRYIPCW